MRVQIEDKLQWKVHGELTLQFYYYYGVYLSSSTPALLFVEQSCDYEYICDVERMHIYSCLAQWFYIIVVARSLCSMPFVPYTCL